MNFTSLKIKRKNIFTFRAFVNACIKLSITIKNLDKILHISGPSNLNDVISEGHETNTAKHKTMAYIAKIHVFLHPKLDAKILSLFASKRTTTTGKKLYPKSL